MAAFSGLALGLRMGYGSGWLMFGVGYLIAFLGFHVLMVPLMTGWHLASTGAERWIRSIIEEEMIRADMQNYERQLRRVFPGRSSEPSKPEG